METYKIVWLVIGIIWFVFGGLAILKNNIDRTDFVLCWIILLLAIGILLVN